MKESRIIDMQPKRINMHCPCINFPSEFSAPVVMPDASCARWSRVIRASSSRSPPPTSGPASARASAAGRCLRRLRRRPARRRRARVQRAAARRLGAVGRARPRGRRQGRRSVDRPAPRQRDRRRPRERQRRRGDRHQRPLRPPRARASELRDAIRGADIVANPGCYPTSISWPAPARRARADRARRDDRRQRGQRRHRRRQFAQARAALRRGRRRLSRLRRRQHASAPQGDARRRSRAFGADADLLFTPHLLPVARGILSTITVPLTEPLADPLALWRDAVRGRAVHRGRRRAAGAQRRRAPQRRAHHGAPWSAGTRTPTLLVTLGDRQPREGCRRPGAAEREPDVRARRDGGAAGDDRACIKIGGRPQARSARSPVALAPRMARGAGALVRRARRRRRGVHAAAAAMAASRSSSAGAASRATAISRSCAWRSPASANKRLVARARATRASPAVGLSGEDGGAARRALRSTDALGLRRHAGGDEHGAASALLLDGRLSAASSRR